MNSYHDFQLMIYQCKISKNSGWWHIIYNGIIDPSLKFNVLFSPKFNIFVSEIAAIEHFDLCLDVNFETKTLCGEAHYVIDKRELTATNVVSVPSSKPTCVFCFSNLE